MATVTIGEGGQIGLSAEILEQSGLTPGSQMIVLARKGRITLVDRERIWRFVEKPVQEMLATLDRWVAENPHAPFLGGLTFEEYAALSEEEDQALWDRLYAEAEREVKLVEQEIPAHYRPAGQKRR